MLDPIEVVAGATVLVNATTTTARTAIGGLTNGRQIVVTNPGTTAVRHEWGDVTVAATTPVAGGAAGSRLAPAAPFVEVITVPPGTTHVAVKTDSGTGSLEFTPAIGS